MRLVPTHHSEAVIADDRFRLEVLEFSGIGAGVFRQIDQLFCPAEIAVVVGSDVGDKICWVTVPDKLVFDPKFSTGPRHRCSSLGWQFQP
jgi:hypothetical protein